MKHHEIKNMFRNGKKRNRKLLENKNFLILYQSTKEIFEGKNAGFHLLNPVKERQGTFCYCKKRKRTI